MAGSGGSNVISGSGSRSNRSGKRCSRSTGGAEAAVFAPARAHGCREIGRERHAAHGGGDAHDPVRRAARGAGAVCPAGRAPRRPRAGAGRRRARRRRARARPAPRRPRPPRRAGRCPRSRRHGAARGRRGAVEPSSERTPSESATRPRGTGRSRRGIGVQQQARAERGERERRERRRARPAVSSRPPRSAPPRRRRRRRPTGRAPRRQPARTARGRRDRGTGAARAAARARVLRRAGAARLRAGRELRAGARRAVAVLRRGAIDWRFDATPAESCARAAASHGVRHARCGPDPMLRTSAHPSERIGLP